MSTHVEHGAGMLWHTAAAVVTAQLTMLNSDNARFLVVFGYVYGIICQEKREQFLADLLTFNFEFNATCCAIMSSSRVHESLNYEWAAFSDHVQEVLQDPLEGFWPVCKFWLYTGSCKVPLRACFTENAFPSWELQDTLPIYLVHIDWFSQRNHTQEQQ